jgi:cytochrome P450
MLSDLLYLPLTLCAICSLVVQCIQALFQHTFIILCYSPSPNDVASSMSSIAPADAPEPIPLVGSYIGTIFGWFDSLKGSKRLYQRKENLNAPVFATNDGSPVVMCLDYASAEVLFKGRHLQENARPVTFRVPTLLTCGGDDAVKHRQLLLSVLSQNETDENFLRAMDVVRVEFQRWDETKSYLKNSIFDLIRLLVFRFLSSMMFGVSLSTELLLLARVSSLDFFLYPAYPLLLTPTYHQRKEAYRLLLIEMKLSPKWSSIERTIHDLKMSEEDAVFTLIAAITTNSTGLAMLLRQIVLFLSSLNEIQRAELLSQSSLLESFIWECIRLIPPTISYSTKEATDIKTSCGKYHRVKKGTKLLAPLAVVTRDPLLWRDPHVFKPNRFTSSATSTPEPIPSISFGCPLGTMDDTIQHQNTHQCTYMPMTIPTAKLIVQILLQDCKWELDANSSLAMDKYKIQNQSESTLPEYDVHPSGLHGGPSPVIENQLIGTENAKFALFHYSTPVNNMPL